MLRSSVKEISVILAVSAIISLVGILVCKTEKDGVEVEEDTEDMAETAYSDASNHEIIADQSNTYSRSESEVESPYKLKAEAYNGLTEPLPPHNQTTYDAEKLVDGNPKTGWAIAFSPTKGMNEPIWGPNIEFSENSMVDYIVVSNGYGKSTELYQKNWRPAWITIYRPIAPDTGNPEPEDILYDGPITDTMKPQKLAVNSNFDYSRPVKNVIVKLPQYADDKYYRGVLYDHLVISEIEFWGRRF